MTDTNQPALRPRTVNQPRPGYILIVEDEDALRTIVAGELRSNGYRVEATEGVEAALKPLQGGKCLLDHAALLITDMKLPNGRSGLELLTHLRMHNLSIPVIAMSAMFNTPGWPREQEVRDAGAMEVMYKPFDMDELLNVVNTYIHRS